jgi:hypothetical protein
MKWRQTIIYFVILLLAGGYFYYFEVVKKEEKQAAEKEAKIVFNFKPETVQALQINSKDKQSVQLKREEQWRIVEPISAEVDTGAVDDYLRTLSALESERKIADSPQDLKPFGLEEPSLKIRVQTGDQWLDLLVGDRTVIGEGRYAALGEKKDLFLLAEGNWPVLNKGLDELRRKALFTFQSGEVTGVQVAWRDGATVNVDRQADGDTWKVPDQPDLKIKKSKVENILEQIHWLRAQSFQENEVKNLDSHGLNPPHVTVELRLKDDKSAQLMLSEKKEQESSAFAVSSEISAVVRVDATVLDDLPKTAQALEDRSLLGIKTENVKQVKWRIGETGARVVRMGENKWGIAKDDKEPQPLKESWHVKSLLWDLGESEYARKVEPQPEAPATPHGRVELLEGEKTLVALNWEKIEGNDGEPRTVWIERSGENLAVQVSLETIDKIVEDLERILHPEQSGSPS